MKKKLDKQFAFEYTGSIKNNNREKVEGMTRKQEMKRFLYRMKAFKNLKKIVMGEVPIPKRLPNVGFLYSDGRPPPILM